MRKLLFYLLLFFFSGVIIFFVKKDNTLKDLSINVLAGVLIILLDKLFDNFRLIWLFIMTNTTYRKKKIRISISYLFKIKINDVYLLVRGKRIANQFQPVGGVFKRYRESYYSLEKLKVTDDDNIPIDDKSINDLRIKLPSSKVISFLKWYNSQLGREVSPYREFVEELIEPGILTRANFPYLNYIHRNRHMTPIHFSNHFQCHEILIAEIFELKPNDNQANELKSLLQKNDSEYIWVKEDAILRRGVAPGQKSDYTISETSGWIL